MFEKAVGLGFLKGRTSPSPSFAGPLIALTPVYEAGTPERVQRFGAPFLADSGAPLAAMAFSEPGGSANFDAGAPAAGITTTATPTATTTSSTARRREVINKLVQVVGVTAYDQDFPLVGFLNEAVAYPLIEGSNIGVRRRQLQSLFLSPGYDPLAASGMS